MTDLAKLIAQVEVGRDDAAARWADAPDTGYFNKNYWNGKRDAYDNVLHLLRDQEASA